MADNPQDNTSGVSPEDKIRNQQLIGFLKERLRLTTEYKDILRESINESRKMAREIERQNSRIETINRETINTRQLNSEIVKVQQAQYVNAQKLLDIKTLHGITDENIANSMERYDKSVNEKIAAEAEYNRLMAEQNLTLDNIHKNNADELKLAKDVVNAKKVEESLLKEINKIDQKKLELAQLEIDALAAADAGNEDLFNQLTEQIALKQKDASISKQHYSDLNKQLVEIQKVSQATLSDDAQRYVTNSQALDKAEETLDVKKQELDATLAQMTEGQLAFIQAKEQEKTLQQQLNLTKERANLEKEVANNLGLSGGFAKILADKLGVGNEVYGAMTLKAREIAEKEEKRKELNAKLAAAVQNNNVEQQNAINQQLAGLGKQQGMLSARFSVMKAGGSAAFKAIGNAMKDPVAMASAIGAGLMAAQAGLNAVGNAARGAGNFMAGLSQHSSNVVRNLTSGVTGLIEKIPLVGGLIAGIVDGMAAFADLVLGQDAYIVKMGRSIGISANEAKNLYDRFSDLNLRAQKNNELTLISTEQYFESYVQLTKNLGVLSGISDQIVQQNELYQKRLGLTDQESAALIKTQQISGKNSDDIIKSTLGQVDAIKKSTGIALNYKDVIKSVTSLSGVLGLQFAKYPDKIKSAVVNTKLLGMELSKIDSVADQFLDFESSISKEFEAQLLTGKDINLNKARELALNNDIAGLAAEISNQLGDSESFANMNRIQQQAIASALGMSRDELGDILKQQSYYAALQLKSTGNAEKDEKLFKEKLKDLRAMGKSAQELAEQYEIGADQFENLLKQSALEDFEDLITKIKIAFVDFASKTGFVDKIKAFLEELKDPTAMQSFLFKVRDAFANIAETVVNIAKYIVEAVRSVYSLNPFADESKLQKMDELIAKMGVTAKQVKLDISNVGKFSEQDIQKGLENKSLKQQDGKIYEKYEDKDGKEQWREIQKKQLLIESDKTKLMEDELKKAKFERGDVGTGGYLAATGTGAAAGALVGSIVPVIGTGIGAAIGAAGGLISAFIKDQLNEAKRATNESNAAYLNQTQNMSFSGGFGVSPSFYNATHPELLNPPEKHAIGGAFTKETTLIDPKTSTPHTFGEAGPEILTPLDKLEDYIMKPVDKMMQVVESKFDSVVFNAADFIKSNTTSNELDKIIDLTTSILTGKSKEDNYAKAQPQLQVAQSERPAEYVFNIKTEVKGIDEKVVGEANQRYAFQMASSKIERRTGPF